MKTKFVIALFFELVAVNMFGHEVLVHQAITVNAAAAGLANSPSFADFMSLISNDCNRFTATNSMMEGSGREDDKDKDEGGKRSFNHFYDPLDHTYGKGLTDSPPDRRVLTGTNSFAWASVTNCSGIDFNGVSFLNFGQNLNTSNIWSWQNTRGFEWIGLTATGKVDRNRALTNMFRALGQVMHLLEDTTSPQHVRNEQHLDEYWKGQDTRWRSPIEDYGGTHNLTLNYQQSMLDWKSAGFTKVEDFWDRHFYDGSVAALNADTGGGANTLGLAEWCNGNFLGARHIYSEYFPKGDISYYPYPSRDSGTQYKANWANPFTKIDDSTLMNDGSKIKRVYLQKTSDGIQIQHHSLLQYIDTVSMDSTPGMPPSASVIRKILTPTINDSTVLQEYHSILIPKAVGFSAGLLDYFFRGALTVGVSGSSGSYTLAVVNGSDQDFKGGSFSLFREDSAGTRTLVQPYALPGILKANDYITLAYSGTVTEDTPFVLVYQGTIGIDGSNNPCDPVDANIGIVAQRFTLNPGGCSDCTCSPIYDEGCPNPCGCD